MLEIIVTKALDIVGDLFKDKKCTAQFKSVKKSIKLFLSYAVIFEKFSIEKQEQCKKELKNISKEDAAILLKFFNIKPRLDGLLDWVSSDSYDMFKLLKFYCEHVPQPNRNVLYQNLKLYDNEILTLIKNSF